MLKITGPYSAADLNWDAPTNIAEVGKRYCIGIHSQTIEKCSLEGWFGSSNWVYIPRDGCPPDTIQVRGKPACPNRSAHVDEFEVESEITEILWLRLR